MKVVWSAALILALMLAFPAASMAYTSDIGNRAMNLSGWDIVHHCNVQLDDYLGQWVLLEFTALWCGPCNQERPEFLKAIKPYTDSGSLAVIIVSCDNPKTLPDLKRAIKKYRIDYPVLYDGGEFQTIPVLEWCGGDSRGFGIPTAYLINPQGVIVAANLRSEGLPAQLDYYMQSQPPVIGLSTRHTKNSDGSVTFIADVWSPSRQPTQIKMSLLWEEWICDPQDPKRETKDIKRNYEWDYLKADLVFDEFGLASYQYTFKPAPNQDIVGYYFHVLDPNSLGVSGLPKDGQWVNGGDAQAFLLGIEHTGEYWRVLPD